ncbi:MAG: hypothetical protein NWF01_07975 [Candidatus Bathyarchaeota archaeon]|nr:hypothetical protein [Candidatus Bathyarchaeota archaeon]
MSNGLPQTKLYSVSMGAGAKCDCGKEAETQFVLTTGKGEAKRLAAEAKRARAVGSKTLEVCCGQCVAKKIADAQFFVTEELRYHPIKWERIPDDLECRDCKKKLPFGSWAHYHADTNSAICDECGVNRGWTDKNVASTNVKALELKKLLAALRKRVKVESEGLSLVQQQVVLHEIGAKYGELEKQIMVAMSRLERYLTADLGTPEDKTTMRELEAAVYRLQDLACSIQREISTRLFWLDKRKRENDTTQQILEEDEADEQRRAEGAMSEVPH